MIEIKGRTVIEFDIVVDKDIIFTFTQIRVLFTHFPTYYTLGTLINEYDVLDLGVMQARDNTTILDYFVTEGILKRSNSSYEFFVLDRDRLCTVFNSFREVYQDLFDNYKAYERDFIIDKVIDI